MLGMVEMAMVGMVGIVGMVGGRGTWPKIALLVRSAIDG